MKTPRKPFILPTLVALVVAAALGACSSGSGAAGPRVRGSADTITEQELEPVSQMSAYDAIRRLRPRWLQSRTGQLPAVHVDGAIRNDGEEILSSINCSEVQEMRYMSAPDATTRFGTNYMNGLILITTKR